MKKQAYNPYLPSYEYIPDGEPHVFGDRVYIYGSHDCAGHKIPCFNDYICYSASVEDLTNWRYEGVIFQKIQDPRNQNLPEDAPEGYLSAKDVENNPKGIHSMWAPDVVQGPDGRYYLYYCLDFLPEIGVAVCNTPAGRYEFLGFVKHQDQTPLGLKVGDLEQFDPGVYVEGDKVYLYSGHVTRLQSEYDESLQSMVMQLEPDMVTLKTEPKIFMPDLRASVGTGFQGHEFFEASSIRKIDDTYYFVYSSVNMHELCYATSKQPDGDYIFGGTLVDIADVFLNGRTEAEAINAFDNTHGGIECINGKWYVFYHRQTNRTQSCRQACAERIYLREDGGFSQVEVTSCGLNEGPLLGEGRYPARICCHLTGKKGAVRSTLQSMGEEYPYLTQDEPDIEASPEWEEKDRKFPVQYIANMQDGSTVGYKYFDMKQVRCVELILRGHCDGVMRISIDSGATCYSGTFCGEIPICLDTDQWTEVSGKISIPDGMQALYFTYEGQGRFDFAQFTLK